MRSNKPNTILIDLKATPAPRDILSHAAREMHLRGYGASYIGFMYGSCRRAGGDVDDLIGRLRGFVPIKVIN
jgi:hypothetical protein